MYWSLQEWFEAQQKLKKKRFAETIYVEREDLHGDGVRKKHERWALERCKEEESDV